MAFEVILKEMREEAVPLLGEEPSRQRTASRIPKTGTFLVRTTE